MPEWIELVGWLALIGAAVYFSYSDGYKDGVGFKESLSTVFLEKMIENDFMRKDGDDVLTVQECINRALREKKLDL